MNTIKAEVASFETLKDLKPLVSAAGPCMSIYMPLSAVSSNSSGKQNELHWKECVRNIESGIDQYGSAGRELLQSVETWDSVLGGAQPQGKSVAVFRSPDVFQIVWLEHEVKDRCAVGPP